MKVAMVSVYPSEHKASGGVCAVTVVLARALSRFTDSEIHVITVERERTGDTVEKDGAVTVHRLAGSSWPQMLDVIGGPGRRRLLERVRGLAPDILHVHETYGLGLGGLPIPQVFTVHGFDHANVVANCERFRRVRSELWRRVERYGLAKQRHIISITPYVRRLIEPLTQARIYDIDNPIDERFFRIDRQPEPGRILCVGWVNERKNTLGAVEAFARVAAKYPHAKLVVAGQATESGYLDRIRRCIEEHGLAGAVEMPGYVNHSALEKELARADAFLLPSRQENSPMAIAEAMAAGLPVIASNRCGMPYMIRDNETGFLVDPESTEQIADRLDRLLGSPTLGRQMGEAGRRVALERFHPRAVAEETRKVYEEIRVCWREQGGKIFLATPGGRTERFH